MHILSIIIPIYNAEKYLSSCLNSVLGVKTENYIIYLVDDGSIDGSLGICRKYADEHPNIVVISQTNAGPSAARNAALSIAKEEYIAFLDADDEIEPETFKKNIEWLVSHPDVDALFYPIQQVRFDGSVTQKVDYDTTVILEKTDAWEKWCKGNKQLPGFFGGKIYHRRLFDGLKIPDHLRFAEDMYLLSDLLTRANKVCLSQYGNYRYYERENAATQTAWTASKASNIGEAYFHRWQMARQSHLSTSSIVHSWQLAFAETVAERKRFPTILSDELLELKKQRPSFMDMFQHTTPKAFLGILRNLLLN